MKLETLLQVLEARHKKLYIVCKIPLISSVHMDKSRDRMQTDVCQGLGWGWGENEWLLHGYRDSFWDNEKVLELDSSDVCTTF